jgi:hypothetical protein
VWFDYSSSPRTPPVFLDDNTTQSFGPDNPDITPQNCVARESETV